jgi:hypothetical protein
MEKKYGAFTSSQNPQEISNRVKGIVLSLSAIIIFVAGNVFNINLQPNDVTDIATQLGGVVGAVWTIYGAILALIARFTRN